LGIAPVNTTLSISFRTNEAIGSSVAANSIVSIGQTDLVFEDEQSLTGDVLSIVKNSLEVTNEEPIASVNTTVTLEELKQRAIGSYAAQNRAVSKQDYESLVYNMPAKFGAIKRANIINDPSATNRRLALYIISENSSGNLAPSGEITKNNLKNWLGTYKMLNDVIEIFDTKIINFSIEFSAHLDKRYDPDETLAKCIQKIRDLFSEVSYIGEPIYITRIYKVLNDLDGIIDVKQVKLVNLTGGVYSTTPLNFDDALSKDGTFIKIPQNAIYELKNPDSNIKGTVK
jgi:hypothetical protein